MKKSGFLALSSLLWLLLVAPAAAQTGNQSDVSGTTTTGGEVAGGSVGTATQTGTGTGATTSPAQTQSLQAAAGNLSSNLSTGNQTSVSGTQISANAQVSVLSLLTSPTPAAQTQVLGALETMGAGESGETGPGASGSAAGLEFARGPNPGGRIDFSVPRVADNAARELVAAVSGLLGVVAGMEPANIELTPTQRLIHAVDEFNEFVDTVPIESLRNPPDEFLAIHAVLVSMVQAADVSAR